MGATFRAGSDEYTVSGTIGELPAGYSAMLEHASLHDDFGVKGPGGTLLVITVDRAGESWPGLVISQRFDPGPESGFHPGAMLIPENHLLLVGAGTRLLAYDLEAPRRVWEDVADVGFWRWTRHGNVVLMSAELELAAWDVRGAKLWSTFVEPPWHYQIRGTELELDVMGTTSRFDAIAGPTGRGAR